MDKEKQKEDVLVVYKYLVLQHAALKCILEKKYDILMNVNIFENFILKNMKRRYSQYALVALVRAGMVLANQEILMAFVVRRNNWRRKQKTNENKKMDQQKRKLQDMQKPTSEAIKEQVSNEVTTRSDLRVSCRSCFKDKF